MGMVNYDRDCHVASHKKSSGARVNLRIGVKSTPDNIISYFSPRISDDVIHGYNESITVFDGSPQAVIESRDVFYIPQYVSLYSSSGVRMAESCVRRGRDLSEYVDAGPEIVKIPDNYHIVEEPMLYFSSFANNWGHFLTEYTSRLWAKVEFPELAGIPGFYAGNFGGVIGSPYAELLDSLGLRPGHNLKWYSGPVLFRRVFVPVASFSNRGEAYTVHKQSLEKLSEPYICSNKSNIYDQPVFLSRSLITNGRQIIGEAALDEVFKRNGFLVVHLEKLSISEQIELFNCHKRFVGFWGAAFHGLALAGECAAKETNILCGGLINPNYVMFDYVCGNRSKYVDCLRDVPERKQEWPNTVSFIDEDVLSDFLDIEFGIRL
jgi:hypothetical protein